MKAVRIHDYGTADQLRVDEIERPAPRAGQVLVRVGAASVNPFDMKVRSGKLKGFYPLPLPHILGTDFAGEVVEVGTGVTGLRPGDRVFGMLTPMHGGTYTEYLATDAVVMTRAPSNLDDVEAAALPLVGVTALIAVHELANVQPGQRVLVHGAGGGVGGVAVMLAKHRGAHVVATCGTDKVALVKSLGADEVIDWRTTDFRQATSSVDTVIDPIGGETNLRSYELLKPGGTMVVILRYDPIEMANRQQLSQKHQVTVKEVAYDLNPLLLDTLRALAEEGAVRPNVQKIFPLEQAADAQRWVETGHAAGKVVLKIR